MAQAVQITSHTYKRVAELIDANNPEVKITKAFLHNTTGDSDNISADANTIDLSDSISVIKQSTEKYLVSVGKTMTSAINWKYLYLANDADETLFIITYEQQSGITEVYEDISIIYQEGCSTIAN